jgi:ribose 5-phosphate isomerase B
MTKKELVLGCDNAAIGLMKEIRDFLDEQQIPYTYMGVEWGEDDTYYPLVAEHVAEEIITSGYQKDGILICGTGIGMSITANKFPGIYAAVCHDNYSAERARLSNNSNVLCMGARIIGPELAKKILREWLSLEFNGGRSQPKLDIIKGIEQKVYK